MHLPYVFKVNPINRIGETPFSQTPFGLGNTGGDVKRKRKRILVGEVDDRVSNDNADKDLKMKHNEDWEKVFCGANAIHRIKWNNNGCLMHPRWFSKHYCFKKCSYKTNHVADYEVPKGKRKAYKTYLKKNRS